MMRRTSILLALIALLTLIAISSVWGDPDWMGNLPDTLLISELSIPGTHNTMALYGSVWGECQSLTLNQQLEAGIRALDIRCQIAIKQYILISIESPYNPLD